MELEKLTALQLGEKIKQRQVSVLDGVKTVFEQIEKQDSEVHASLHNQAFSAFQLLLFPFLLLRVKAWPGCRHFPLFHHL